MRRVLGQVIVAAALGLGSYQVSVAQEYTQQEIEILTSKAMAGDAEAQFDLGVRYDAGRGVRQDEAQAFAWFEKAAAQGVAEAQFNLGLMYANGEGVRQDYAKAIEWYKKAAAQDYAKAQSNFGLMYAKGEGVRQD